MCLCVLSVHSDILELRHPENLRGAAHVTFGMTYQKVDPSYKTHPIRSGWRDRTSDLLLTKIPRTKMRRQHGDEAHPDVGEVHPLLGEVHPEVRGWWGGGTKL